MRSIRRYILRDTPISFRRGSHRLALPLYEGGAPLLNPYSIFLPTGLTGTEREAGTALASWLADGQGRKLVAGFVANGWAVFTIWPAGIPRDKPTDLPDVR